MEKEIKISHFSKKQTHRCNNETQNVEDYYRRSIFIPFEDHMWGKMERLFLQHRDIFASSNCFIPHKNHSTQTDSRSIFELSDIKKKERENLLIYYENGFRLEHVSVIGAVGAGEPYMWYWLL